MPLTFSTKSCKGEKELPKGGFFSFAEKKEEGIKADGGELKIKKSIGIGRFQRRGKKLKGKECL